MMVNLEEIRRAETLDYWRQLTLKYWRQYLRNIEIIRRLRQENRRLRTLLTRELLADD